MTRTITIKMTWADCLIPLLAVYCDGSPKGRADALKELRRMAHAADIAANAAKASEETKP